MRCQTRRADFQFTHNVAGVTPASPFFLDDDANGDLPNTRTLIIPPNANNSDRVVNLAEVLAPNDGWDLTGLVCSKVDVPAGIVGNDPVVGAINQGRVPPSSPSTPPTKCSAPSPTPGRRI